jgi:hypothetical protein
LADTVGNAFISLTDKEECNETTGIGFLGFVFGCVDGVDRLRTYGA